MFLCFFRLTGCSPFYGKNYNEILSKNRKCDINYNFQEKLKLKISEGGKPNFKLNFKFNFWDDDIYFF